LNRLGDAWITSVTDGRTDRRTELRYSNSARRKRCLSVAMVDNTVSSIRVHWKPTTYFA